MITNGRFSPAAMMVFLALVAGPALAGFSDNVRYVQEALAEFGYQPGVADGIWGRRTQQAMQAFQRDNGLPLSSDLTDEFIQALRAHQIQTENFPPVEVTDETPAPVPVLPEREPQPVASVPPPLPPSPAPSVPGVAGVGEAMLLERWTFSRPKVNSVAELSGPQGAAVVKVAVRQKYASSLIQGRSPKDLIRGFYGSVYFRDLSRLCHDAAPVGGIDALELRQIIEDANETVTVATRTPMVDCRAYINGTLSERGLMAKISILPN
ncbi:MAG: peptidoglycan-binding protein [Chromatiales bacterium]|nr:peptidoglycan-binding protein [Chromatiales bacterium]